MGIWNITQKVLDTYKKFSKFKKFAKSTSKLKFIGKQFRTAFKQVLQAVKCIKSSIMAAIKFIKIHWKTSLMILVGVVATAVFLTIQRIKVK